MNAERLRHALRDNDSIVWGAPGLQTISAKVLAIRGSLKMEKRSTHECNERRTSATRTCFNEAELMDGLDQESPVRTLAPGHFTGEVNLLAGLPTLTVQAGVRRVAPHCPCQARNCSR
jgi:hypothetical protein